MLVLFKDNFDCVIKGAATLRLGDMLCDILNMDMGELKILEKELMEALQSIDPVKKHIYDNTVSYYFKFLNEMDVAFTQYRSKMKKLPFYIYSNDVDTSFDMLYSFINDMKRQLTHKLQTALIPDVGLTYDPNFLKKTSTDIIKLFKAIYMTYAIFRPAAEACLIYNSVTTEEKPDHKLKTYGLDKLNNKILLTLKNTHVTEISSLSLLYEFDDTSENLSLVQYYEINKLPQYIYHEFMKMVGSNLYVKHCKYCGKYYVIYGERIPGYCNNVPEGETKPCSVIGPARLYGEKVKNDPILDIYTRAYKKYVARRRSGSISPEEFKQWTVKARKLREKAYAEGVSPDVFIDWMK